MQVEAKPVFKTVGEIMVADVVTVSPNATVSAAAVSMREGNIGSVVILDSEGIAGIVTERDLAYKVVAEHIDPRKTRVSKVMTKNVVTATPDTTIVSAAKTMGEKHIKKLPVVDDQRLVGIVTETDLATALNSTVLHIIPSTEKPDGRQAQHKLEEGVTYLIDGENAHSFEMFVDKVMAGTHGLCITRDHPQKISEQWGLAETPVLWLTDVSTKEHAVIPDHTHLAILIGSFLDQAEKPVILLEGLDYLIERNSFSEVLELIQHLRDQVAEYGAHLILPVSRKTLSQQQLNKLSRGLRVIDTDEADVK